MSLKFRRFLYITFIVAFLVIVPLVCLYAAGYKISTGMKIEKTGILLIDTRPKGADIYLNGEHRQPLLDKYLGKENYVKTPAKLKNLRPGDYDIRLESPGYWPWTKKLTVRPGETTYAENVFLLKNDLPLLLRGGEFENMSLSPNKKYLAAHNEKGVEIINIDTGEVKEYFFPASASTTAASTTASVFWSASSRKFVCGRLLFDVNDHENPLPLDKILGTQADKFQWDAANDNILYYKDGASVAAYDFGRNEHSTLSAGKLFFDYLVKGDVLHLLDRTAHSAALESYTLGDLDLVSRFRLPDSSYTFLNPEHQYINLYDTEHEILYLIDPWSEIKPLKETVSNVNKTFWIGENELLYANDFEVWIYDLKNFRKTLLTRVSERMLNVFRHPGGQHIVYVTTRGITVIELDRREKYNITRLINLDDIGWSALDKKGNAIYFYAKIGNQRGIYQLKIQ